MPVSVKKPAITATTTGSSRAFELLQSLALFEHSLMRLVESNSTPTAFASIKTSLWGGALLRTIRSAFCTVRPLTFRSVVNSPIPKSVRLAMVPENADLV